MIRIRGDWRPEPPGYYQGRHFSEYRAEVLDLKRAGRLAEAERLLLALVDAAERESKAEREGVVPWVYEQLAIVYRKRRDRAGELRILERFAEQRQRPGAGPARLLERLAKVKARAATEGPRSA